MKNLFKNLMLVAVAAMAFVACSQEGNEVNILTKETTFEFTAGFNEDTRSGFGEKEGDAYPSVWNGGESIIAIFSNEDGVIGTAYSNIDDLGEGVESSKTATFTVKYEGSLPDNYSVTFYSGSWYTNYETGEAYYYISDNQRCTDTSVESSNHLCKTEAIEVVNGEISTLNLTFNTATAFGKVTMEQFSDVADKIEEVKVTINDNTTYTVTPNELTKPVVWFACEAIESVTSLIVEAKVDGVTYIKTKEDIAEGALSFNTGRIRPINVKDMTEKPADYTFAFDSCEAIDAYGGYWGDDNYYAFKFTNSNNNQEWYLGFSAEDITNDTLPIGTFEVTNNMEQGKVYGNGSFLLNIDEFNNDYATYLTEGTVTISENEGVYNVLAKVKAYVNGGSRTIDISFEGTIAQPEPIGDSFTYLGRYYDIDSDASTSGGGYMYKVVADGVEYSLELYWAYANEDGAIKVGTYNYCSNMPDYMNSSWAGFSIISDSYHYGSTLKATADGVVTLTLKDVDGNLIGEYVYEGVATFGEEETPADPTDVTELTITSHGTLYTAGGEHEIGFYADGQFVDIDFLAYPITAGTYTLVSGLYSTYCRYNYESMSECTVIVTDNGDGTLTFDATFKVGDGNWYHFNYTAKIYE